MPTTRTSATISTLEPTTPVNGGSLKLEFGLPAALTLVSISSYDNFELNDLLDQDDTSAPTINNTQVGVFESKQLTQEFRLLSSDDQPLRYTLGLYYGDTELDRDFRRGPVFALARWVASSDSTQKAIFGQADWEFVKGTTLTAGIRHQEEDIDYTFLDIQNANAFFDGDANDKFETYRLGLQHQFTDDIMAYAAYRHGSQGADLRPDDGFQSQSPARRTGIAGNLRELRDRRAHAVLRPPPHAEHDHIRCPLRRLPGAGHRVPAGRLVQFSPFQRRQSQDTRR